MPDAAEPEIRTSARLVPEQRNTSGFDIVHTFSTRHQRFALARLLSPYLTRASLAFSSTLPSRPGEFHPEPLTEPDLSLSTYPARATPEGCRLPPRPRGSSGRPVTLAISSRVTRPLRSTGITPLQHYYGAVRTWPAPRYFRPRGTTTCAFSLLIADLKFRARARIRVTPPIHRTPHGQ